MKTEYTKYLVGYDSVGRHVEIYLEGNEPSSGHRTIGEFSANVLEGKMKGDDEFNTGGDHLLIAGAKKVLEDLEITDFQGMTYEDKASNAPTGDSYVMSHADRERAVRNGENPAETQAHISDNLDKAEAKYEKKDHNVGSKGKNDSKPRSNA